MSALPVKQIRAEILLQKFFDREISTAEAEELLALWDDDEPLENAAWNGLEWESVLRLMGSLAKEPCVEPGTTSSLVLHSPLRVLVHSPDNASIELSDLIDLPVHLERSAPSTPQKTPEPSSPVSTVPVRGVDRKSRNTWLTGWQLAGIILLLALTGIFFEFFGASASGTRNAGTSFARIAEMIDVEWDEGIEPFKEGANIGSEPFRIKKGLVKLAFHNGVEQIIEGPAECVVNGPLRVFCRSGKINTVVSPEAHGFELVTPFSSITDLGTEFSVAVGEAALELHVVSGKVEFRSDKNNRTPISERNAVRIGIEGETQPIPFAKTFCVDAKAFRLLSTAFSTQRQQRRQVCHDRLLADPDLAFLFDDGDVVRGNATLYGGSKVNGAQKGSKAVRFQSPVDRLELDIPGNMTQLTLALFMRPHRLTHVSRLLIGNDFYAKAGSFFWQLDRNGNLQFHIHADGGNAFRPFDIDRVVTPKDRETWTMLAVAVDTGNGSVVHYKDGRPIGRFTWSDPRPLNIGQATFGNEPVGTEKNYPRFLDADIDMLLVFRRALSEREIAGLHDDLK